ncbi:MAG: F0F1 ATP synthase subunit epsilon [Dehalococcoidia bacterium]|nr:F0F1 ATP synthase subunit epsilon [Dehalococcoidia bacterium]
MSTLKLEIVTVEGVIYSDDVNVVVAPGIEGQLGILPHHAPLMTMLEPGEVVIKKGGEETIMAVSGGYLEVSPDKVVILADAAERAEEINVERAEAARKRAQERMKNPVPGMDQARAEAALMRSMTRLKVAQSVRKRRGGMTTTGPQ